jgi:hypothetical protein
MITCDPSTSVMVEPARSAIERTTSAPAALSPVATTVQEGRCSQAGGPDGSENADSATGRWVAAINAVSSGGRSPANASWNLSGSITNSAAVPPPLTVGNCRGTSALFSTLSFEPASACPSASPSSGANAATNTRPTTLLASLAALVITAPPYE